MHIPEMFSDHGMFMFLYALMEMAARVSNIICITQITYKKCRSKLECLIYEMLWIKNKGPKLNTQADSIHAKLFT